MALASLQTQDPQTSSCFPTSQTVLSYPAVSLCFPTAQHLPLEASWGKHKLPKVCLPKRPCPVVEGTRVNNPTTIWQKKVSSLPPFFIVALTVGLLLFHMRFTLITQSDGHVLCSWSKIRWWWWLPK